MQVVLCPVRTVAEIVIGVLTAVLLIQHDDGVTC